MTAGVGQPWDALQREVLAELGHAVYRVAPRRPAGRGDGPVPDDALLLALLRAAGRARDDEDAARVCAAWPTPQALRGNVAAKRALWPQVRALRASAPPG